MCSKHGESVQKEFKYTNRLAKSKSPYLLQHAHNPVEWFPWGNEAIEKARRENKLIFLSVGYSTCHWCHVMEHESFESEAIAAIMNENFVNIKVDREERPDIDKLYMNYLVMRNGSGGWPMSIWITPDLAPIAAGTYFPPKDRWGMPSFETVLKSIAMKWKTSEKELKTAGLEVISLIQKSVVEKDARSPISMGDTDEILKDSLEVYKRRFDKINGGFGSKPKFPEVPRINFLFHAYIITKDTEILNIALHTLRNISKGGIHDHIFGGFSRYAVDNNWHIPHFEKMLYDQAQLLSAFANAYKITEDSHFLYCAERIFNYINSDLKHHDGGFYAGEDADSLPSFEETSKVEGAFYAWSWEEIKTIVLKNNVLCDGIDALKSFEVYAYYYGLKPDGNVNPSSDPHSHLKNKNILIISTTEEDTIKKFNITNEQLQLILKSTNKLLHEERKLRPRPHLDTKIICAWNGLVLSGLAKLISCNSSNNTLYYEVGTALIAFVKNKMFDQENGQLVRLWYGNNGENNINEQSEIIHGFLDDYAFWIKGLLDFYKISLDSSFLHWAKQLQDIQDQLFWDAQHGAYFYSRANSPNVIVRLKEDHDGAEPCGNSVASNNLLLLAHYFDEPMYRKKVSQLFNFFSDQEPFGYALPEMMSSLLLHEYGLDLVAIVGPASENTNKFLEICHKYYVPGMIIIRVDPEKPEGNHCKKLEDKFKMVNNMPTVYICHNKICRMPVVDPEKLKNFMDNYLNAI